MEKIEIGKRWPGAMPGYDSPVFDYTPSGSYHPGRSSHPMMYPGET